MNANKIEFMCFEQKGIISTQSGKPLKLVDQFAYLGSSSSKYNEVSHYYLYLIRGLPVHELLPSASRVAVANAI